MPAWEKYAAQKQESQQSVEQNPVAQKKQYQKYIKPTAEPVADGTPKPELSTWDKWSELVTGARAASKLPADVRNLPELTTVNPMTAPETGGGALDNLQIAAGLLSTFNPEAQKDIIKNAIPEVTFDDFEGATVINLPSGERALLNAPGLSQSDLMTGLAQTLSFFPSSKLANLGKTLLGKLGLGSAAAMATDAGLQGASKALGSEQAYDPTQTAITGVAGAFGELVQPAMTGIKTARQAVMEKVPAELENAFEKGMVMTSDVFPPDTYMGKAWQRIAERTPVMGTGGARAIQQEERKQAVEQLAESYGVRTDTAFDEEIVNSAQGVWKKGRERASKLRSDAVTELNKAGSVDTTDTYTLIDELIEAEKAKQKKADTALIKSLQDTKDSLEGDFAHVIQIRTAVFNEINDVGGAQSPVRSGGDAVLEQVRESLTKDLNKAAENYSRGATDTAGRQAAAKWKASNRIYVDGFNKAREQKLKQVLAKGEATPEVVLSVIRSGKKSDLNRLYGALDMEGRAAVRQQIIRDQMEKAGAYKTPTGAEAQAYINPTILLNNLDAPRNRVAVDVFFKGNERKELEGLKRYLALTRRAQEASAAPDTGAQMGTFFQKPVSNLVKSPFAFGNKIYESATVRNLLIKLNNAKTPQEQSKIYNQLKPLLSEEARREAEQ